LMEKYADESAPLGKTMRKLVALTRLRGEEASHA